MSRMVKKSKRKPRRKFSPAFKEEICSLVRSGRKQFRGMEPMDVEAMKAENARLFGEQ